MLKTQTFRITLEEEQAKQLVQIAELIQKQLAEDYVATNPERPKLGRPKSVRIVLTTDGTDWLRDGWYKKTLEGQKAFNIYGTSCEPMQAAYQQYLDTQHTKGPTIRKSDLKQNSLAVCVSEAVKLLVDLAGKDLEAELTGG